MEDKQAAEPPVLPIVPDGDLILKLDETERIDPRPQRGPHTKTTTVAAFKVKRATMTSLPHSYKKNHSVLKVMLTGSFRKVIQTTVKFGDDDQEALTFFLYIVHQKLIKRMSMCSLKVAWPLVRIFDKYNVSMKPLAEKWFAQWYEAQGDKISAFSPRELLYPCYKFNHAPGFYKASRDSVYNVAGHITEHNPTNLRDLHLPQRIIVNSYHALVGRR